MANRIESLGRLPPAAKAGIVFGGYAAAFMLAFAATALYIALTASPNRETYAMMYDFGDLLFFVAVFGIVSVVPTGLTLVVLRQSRAFWIIVCSLSLAMAATALVTTVAVMMAPQSSSWWVALSFPRFFLSPFLAVAFGLAALAAPTRQFRLPMLLAAAIEAVSAVYGFIHWFVPLILVTQG